MYVQLGLVPTIVASSVDAAEKVLKTYDHIFANRPHHETSQHLAYGQKNLVFAKYGVLAQHTKISLKKEARNGVWMRTWTRRDSKLLIHTQAQGSFKVFDEFFEKIIDKHIHTHEQKQNKDFVDTMMDIMQSREAKFYTCLAAMDTITSSTEWIQTELLRHSQVTKKLQKELQEVVGFDRTVGESDLENLNYLDMVVKEGLRMHPVAPLFYHKSMEDCVIDGFHVQKGSRIIINCYTIHMDPNVWPEPEKFLPERFVGSNVYFCGLHFHLVPFGSERKSFPGMQLAVTIVRLVVVQLVHCFKWELPNSMQPCDLDIDE
ncbi:hypothetical protein H5410_026399 [Solanum commersonii]|uniref:Cytochrome P450 n=1 Tax=Solanum commersonii TaxID=4109 RepID=A0A9J5YW06_SOLCO|nr:hypothetical protein H5410_026399 [Solanum commersonii]